MGLVGGVTGELSGTGHPAQGGVEWWEGVCWSGICVPKALWALHLWHREAALTGADHTQVILPTCVACCVSVAATLNLEGLGPGGTNGTYVAVWQGQLPPWED